jgi:YD repeat-containing protein
VQTDRRWATTNPQGNTLTYGYDPKGNVDKITDSMPTAGTSRFAYNPNGTVSSSTDAKGNVTTYGYDAKGNCGSDRTTATSRRIGGSS